jgi:hypothetical protein
MPLDGSGDVTNLISSLSSVAGSSGLGGVVAGQGATSSSFSSLRSGMSFLSNIAAQLKSGAWITSADISGSAGITSGQLAGSIVDSKLSTISSAGKVANSATSATSANTGSAIVARDSSGNFSAGTITANLNGNASGTALSLNNGSVTFSYNSTNGTWDSNNSFGIRAYQYGMMGYQNANMRYDPTNGWSFFNNSFGDARVYAGRYTGTGVYGNNLTSPRTMAINSAGDFGYVSSSERFKTNIEPYSVDLNKVLLLDPVTFNWKKDVDSGVLPKYKSAGMIAERLDEAGLNEFVYYSESGEIDGIDYLAFNAVLLSVCKQQQVKLDDLEARLSALEAK